LVGDLSEGLTVVVVCVAGYLIVAKSVGLAKVVAIAGVKVVGIAVAASYVGFVVIGFVVSFVVVNFVADFVGGVNFVASFVVAACVDVAIEFVGEGVVD
jgi:hypothetical protein